MKFLGKIAVVTGAGGGIGAGICEELANEGAHVIVTDVDLDKALEVCNRIKVNHGIAHAERLDITDKQCIKEVCNHIKDTYGIINIWVNNAGVSFIKPFKEHSEDMWDTTMNINLKAQFLCCKEAIEQMLILKEGNIINLSSQSGKVGTNWYQAYCASKFGVIGLTQSLAKEYGPQGIRVNAICPGVVYTSMWDKQKEDYASKSHIHPDEVMDYFKNKIPLRRLGNVKDIAKVISFLVSDDASYITGQSINVNGGDLMY